MRAFFHVALLAIVLVVTANRVSVHAQTNEHNQVEEDHEDAAAAPQQPAGPPPTPRHTGIKALVKGIVVDFKYVPTKENALWAGVGGGLALAVHPFDDDVNKALVGNDAAQNFFRPGEILGELPTLLA